MGGPRAGKEAGKTGQLRLPSRACISEIGYQLATDDVYIGREPRGPGGRYLACSKWATPCKVKDCQSVADATGRFGAHIRGSANLMHDLSELSAKRLVCHCRSG